ncbi:uncharacterized protein LOC115634403 [Scaptodrosophila lebanonensis]|uniref:Uncharacterized protein LOC115634403 n=1 Tax=Drosophila lebanonensis TaxID=7225 RepID=A0A6J2UHN6_DROLE|nr:uncharacterized protein LOC115634403 [Scaptodrosophila lebanonensis]
MPFLEDIGSLTVNTPPLPSDTELDPMPVREITQTDHLNKRLLQYYLQNIIRSNNNESQNPDNAIGADDNEFEE